MLIGLRLCCLTLMVQAAVLDGLVFDAPPFGQDGFALPVHPQFGALAVEGDFKASTGHTPYQRAGHGGF